jgi:hypothetical protein
MNLQRVGPNIWVVDGPPVSVIGPLKLPTRMIVVRLSNGSLWINSPIDIARSEMEDVAQLGIVRHLVSPTPPHDWRLASWKDVFRDAIVWPHRQLGDLAPPEWTADIDQVLFEGNLLWAEAEFFHRESRTLIMADFVQNYPRQSGRPFLNAATRIAGVQAGGVPLDIRLSFFRRGSGRESLRKVLAWDFDRVIVAHGDCIEREAKAAVSRAFGWLGSEREGPAIERG